MRIIKIIIPCLLLNACMFGTSKNAKFYTLTATSGPAISVDYNAFVGVNRGQLPKYVDRPQMVTQQKESLQINISVKYSSISFFMITPSKIISK